MNNKRMRELAGIPAVAGDSGVLLEMAYDFSMGKPQTGQSFGANDQAPPTAHTEDELSRIADLLYAANVVGGKELGYKVFKLLPDSAKGEFNYAQWKYMGAKR